LVKVGTTISSNKDIDKSNNRANALEAIVSNVKKAASVMVFTMKMLRIILGMTTTKTTPKMQMPTTMTAKTSWKMRRTRKPCGSATI
jgi:hypothetical protein